MSAVTWDTTDGWGERVADLATDVDRVADRLRTLSEARLAAPVPGRASRSDAARAASQVLAEVAQGIESGLLDVAPGWREVPRRGDLVVGDQVAVTGHDAVAALAAAGPDGSGWDRAGRVEVGVLQERAADAVRALRALL